MDVDAPSFPHHLLGLFIHISEADFVSFDLELSGIPSRLPNKKPRAGPFTLQDRYAETKEGADRYQILQVGLTCARFDYLANQYVLRPYNINISPLLDERLDFEREITFQSGACTFLLGCGFDLGAPFATGVQYLSREEADRAKRLAYDRIDKVNPISDLQLKPTDSDSLDFVRRCREAITAWAKTSATSLYITSSTGLPGVPSFTISRFEKRLVHQLVRAEFPGAVAIRQNNCIRILDFDAEREADNARRIKNRVKEQIVRQTGFRWVFEALVRGDIHPDLLYLLRSSAGADGRDRFDRACARLKKTQPVLVGHNMFTDIVYLYRTFVGPLPDTLDEFNEALHGLFPRIVDTKYLATHAEGDLNASPTLEEIAKGLQSQALPSIVTHEDHSKYDEVEAFHEAGYDSLLTATVMLRLAAKLGAERSEQSEMSKHEAEQHAKAEQHAEAEQEASEGGVALPISHDNTEHPLAVPPTSDTTDFTPANSKSRKKRKQKRTNITQPPQKFSTTNIFDSLTTLSLSDPPSPSSTADTPAWPASTTAAATGSWVNEAYVPDTTGWVSIKPAVRARMALIPSFNDGFWAAFGNTLRVFGTEEREMTIAAWPGREE
ncbi:CAF1-domain-containing protein [Lizonia empirigonia]|nr:CAF1-domain-containing protein [Lizonia empirigonia]